MEIHGAYYYWAINTYLYMVPPSLSLPTYPLSGCAPPLPHYNGEVGV